MDNAKSRSSVLPALYALTGVVLALSLQALEMVMRSYYMHSAVASTGPGRPTPDQIAAALAQPSGLRLANHAVGILAFACQCAMAFWIGRKTAPKWYWGISPAVPKLLTVICLLLAHLGGPIAHLWPMRMAPMTPSFLIDEAVSALIPVGTIALAACLGGSLRRNERPSREEAPSEGATG